MLYPILFITGAISSIAGAVMGIKEDNDRELQYERDCAAGYNYAAQSRYDYNTGKLFQTFKIDDMMQEIQSDYPKMNDFCARKVAMAAAAKRLLEEETRYKYKPSDDCKYFNLEKYGRDDFKYKEGESMWNRY